MSTIQSVDNLDRIPGSRDASPVAGIRVWPGGAVILFVALLLRVGWAVAIQNEQVSDARAYHLLARQLATGGIYGFDGTPNAFWPVGYPFFLSVQYRLFGENTWPITGIAILLSTLNVALAMALALQWFGSPRIALITGAALTFYPLYIQFVTVTLSETLFTTLLLAAVLTWRARGDVGFSRLVAAGVLLGLASYVRPLALGVAAPLALARLLSGRPLKCIATEFLLVTALVAIIVAPWTYRNYRVYGRPVLVSTNGGMCLFFGNNPLAPNEYQAIIKPEIDGDDAARDAYCAARAVEFIRSDPIAFLKRTIRKAVRVWERDTVGVAFNRVGLHRLFGEPGLTATKVLSQAYWMAFLLACVIGAVLVAARSGIRSLAANPGLWISLSFTAVYAVTFAQDRYHYPLVALLAPLAAHGVAACVRSRVRGRVLDPGPIPRRRVAEVK